MNPSGTNLTESATSELAGPQDPKCKACITFSYLELSLMWPYYCRKSSTRRQGHFPPWAVSLLLKNWGKNRRIEDTVVSRGGCHWSRAHPWHQPGSKGSPMDATWYWYSDVLRKNTMKRPPEVTKCCFYQQWVKPTNLWAYFCISLFLKCGLKIFSQLTYYNHKILCSLTGKYFLFQG